MRVRLRKCPVFGDQANYVNSCERQSDTPRSMSPRVQDLASLGLDSRTALRTFSTEGLKKKRTVLATVLPSTWTVSSPRFPLTTSTSTPGSLRNASAKLAACSRVPAQTGHSRMVTVFMIDLPPFLLRRHPLRTIPRSRSSRMPPLVAGLIRVLLLGTVKCAHPWFCARRYDDTDA